MDLADNDGRIQLEEVVDDFLAADEAAVSVMACHLGSRRGTNFFKAILLSQSNQSYSTELYYVASCGAKGASFIGRPGQIMSNLTNLREDFLLDVKKNFDKG